MMRGQKLAQGACVALCAFLTTGGQAQELEKSGQQYVLPSPRAPVPFDPDPRTWVVPALREWRASPGTFNLRPDARVVRPIGNATLEQIAADLAQDIHAVSGVAVLVAAGKARPGDIELVVDGGAHDGGAESYSLRIGDTVRIEAATAGGVRLGSQSVLQLLRRSADAKALPRGAARDWPDQPMRTMFVDAGRKFYQVSELEDLMRQMSWLKLNTLSLHFTDWPAFRLRSDKFPGLADRLSYGRADIGRLERTAERYGITIIPEIDLPAHSTALLRYKPSLAFKCESMRQSEWLTNAYKERAAGLAWTVDITKSENRAFLQSIIREFLPWFKGPYFHIGGDEYQYDIDKVRCPELMDYTKAKNLSYPGDVFVDWINETDTLVKSLGKKTVMWNWWRFKDDRTSIEPNKDIMIYAWNSPRIPDMLAKGYQVMVTPEDKLYVSPGIENWNGTGYGRFESDSVYEKMPFPKSPRIAGYMIELWADAAESWTDRKMLAKAYEPMAVVAERSWAGAASPNLDAFLDRLNQSSSAPRPSAP